MPVEDVAVCLDGEVGVAGAGVALAGRALCVGVGGAGARAGAVGGPEGDAADWVGGVCLNVTINFSHTRAGTKSRGRQTGP